VLALQAADAIREAVQRFVRSRRTASAEGSRARWRAVQSIAEARDEALQAVGATTAPAARSTREPVVGDRVRVGDLGIIGDVLALHDDEIELAVSGKRLRTPKSSATVIEGGKSAARSATAVLVSRAGPEMGAAEINVVGLRVDEAVPRVDKLLDEAVLAERHEVRIVHGHGQGRLRQAVAELLSGHPHVADFRLGGEREGGGGVTIATLKD
jgi:DNA mismatch repair protein MutS2